MEEDAGKLPFEIYTSTLLCAMNSVLSGTEPLTPRRAATGGGVVLIEILKRAHGKTAPKTKYQDTKPTTSPTSKTLLDIARIPARNQRQHKTPKYLHRLLSQ